MPELKDGKYNEQLTELAARDKVELTYKTPGGSTVTRIARLKSSTVGAPEKHRFGDQYARFVTGYRSDSFNIRVWPSGEVQCKRRGGNHDCGVLLEINPTGE